MEAKHKEEKPRYGCPLWFVQDGQGRLKFSTLEGEVVHFIGKDHGKEAIYAVSCEERQEIVVFSANEDGTFFVGKPDPNESFFYLDEDEKLYGHYSEETGYYLGEIVRIEIDNHLLIIHPTTNGIALLGCSFNHLCNSGFVVELSYREFAGMIGLDSYSEWKKHGYDAMLPGKYMRLGPYVGVPCPFSDDDRRQPVCFYLEPALKYDLVDLLPFDYMVERLRNVMVNIIAKRSAP
jgi:hypothetical protein